MSKKLSLLIGSALIVGSLAACAPLQDSSLGECAPLSPGNASGLVSVSGEFGAAPVVDFPTPFVASEMQTEIVIPGEGRAITGNDFVELEFVGYSGRALDEGVQEPQLQFRQGYGSSAPARIVLDADTLSAFADGLCGVREGSRVLIVSPVGGTFPDGWLSANLTPADSVVFVFDVRRVYLPKADGADQWVTQSGLPSVVRAENGTPGVTIPKSAPDDELKIATLKRGNGPVVEEGDQVTLHYSGWLWDTGRQFESSWSSGSPTQFPIAEGGLIDGFYQALIGQSVGSQVLAVIPPSAGYGESGQGQIPGGATLVFVVDILGID